MKIHSTFEKQSVVEELVRRVKDKFSGNDAKCISIFAQEFLSNVSERDLVEYKIEDLFGLLVTFWKFIASREVSKPNIRVYNPSLETHGWESKHTVVEVSTDDKPFIVDSILMEIERQNFMQNIVIHYGGLQVKREKGKVVDIRGHAVKAEEGYHDEAVVYIEVNRQSDPKILKKLEEGIVRILLDVCIIVEDWREMRDKVKATSQDLLEVKKLIKVEDFDENYEFINWIEANHFTFLGYRYFELKNEGENHYLVPDPSTSLGVLRELVDETHIRKFCDMPEDARQAILSNQIIIITKTSTYSTIHRPVYTDRIWIKDFNEHGAVRGMHEIVGLYTSVAYNTNPRYIPFVRNKVKNALKQSGLKLNSHAGKALVNIMETLPTEDLFQASSDELLKISMGILQIQERRQIRLFVRSDIFGKFVSCMLYIPRDRFNTELREAFQNRLEQAYESNKSNYFTRFSDSILIRTHFIIRTNHQIIQKVDVAALEKDLIQIARSWDDDLKEACLDAFGEEDGHKNYYLYCHAFSHSYKEYVDARNSVHDIRLLNRLISGSEPLELNFYQRVDAPSDEFRFKVYQFGESFALSDVIPILENMGLKVINEQSYKLNFKNERVASINDFAVKLTSNIAVELGEVKEKFQEAFSEIWFGRMENDSFNRLILFANLNWREVMVVRAYAKYLRQTGFTFSQNYIEETFSANPEIVGSLIQLFDNRFSPAKVKKSAERVEKVLALLEKQIDSVTSLDDDRIFRRYQDVILATLRTNFYQKGAKDKHKDYISLKLNPRKIPELPMPRPQFEIFVYSPRFEGVHLRSSKVARGGLRWSDRREDFRTEILGLMKAQQVKNAVIVPSGAKGGFVAKKLTVEMSREEILNEGIACYQNFIRGLLDITDNMKGDKITSPPSCVTYDESDPYFVVAADKGTATFSDIANKISAEYDFWLGDAFASGGSAGYDHKKMGITARGAWESVKRHFRELGIDTQSEDFTVVGIGDMAGDVFGNGMLLSKHIKLVAAFNHVHIFIDPEPDPEISYEERKRLFEMPRSSWEDYNKKLISKGGGVYERSAKTIKITPEAKQIFDIKQDYMAPNDFIHAILKSPVDLMWNGGIGTFIKSSKENNVDVGDRANDAIRVNASDVRFKVIGEGGNLGLTQLARIEYGLNNGKVYSDFIDNSGGVDCSDHEVNIKIMLNDVVSKGDMTLKQRNQLLVDMTDEVARIVLSHNYRQTQAISTSTYQASRNIELHMRFIRSLEELGLLDRNLEFLPDDKALAERKMSGRGLTNTGIAILLSYAKTQIKNNLLESDVPEDPHMKGFLMKAFPERMHQEFSDVIEQHPLRREIIATQLSNLLVNEAGFVFVYRLFHETGAPTHAIVRAYVVIRELFDLEETWRLIESLDNKVPSEVQYMMFSQNIRLIRRTTRWILKNCRMHIDVGTMLTDYREQFAELKSVLGECLSGKEQEEYQAITQSYIDKGVQRTLADRMGLLPSMMSAFDIVTAVKHSDYSLHDVAKMYFLVSNSLDIGWLRQQVIKQPVNTNWEALTREGLRDDLDWQQQLLTIGILDFYKRNNLIVDELNSWSSKYSILVERWESIISELHNLSSIDFTMFFVAIRELLDLTQTCSQRDMIEKDAA